MNLYFFLKVVFILAKCVILNDMPHIAAFHLGPYNLQLKVHMQYAFRPILTN